MNKGLKTPNKLWLKIFIIMMSLILLSLLPISYGQNNDFDRWEDQYYYKNKIYGYYGHLLVKKRRNVHKWCEYRVYETMDELNTIEGIQRLTIENPGGYMSLKYEDKNHVDHIKNPLLYYLNKTVIDTRIIELNENSDITETFHVYKGDGNSVETITPWIKLSDLTPQRLSIESDKERKNAYRAYQICRDFFVDPKPGIHKDLFKFLSTRDFYNKETSFGEGFTRKEYATKYTKADFIEVLSASDTFVQYYTDCEGGRILFFNQRKRLGIRINFSTLNSDFCQEKK